MSYKTAGILSAVLIGSMFLLPTVVESVLLPSLPDPVPFFEQILLNMALFCSRWHIIAVVPILVALFTIAAFTSARARN